MISTDRLLRWFDRYGRDLPWRKTRDPYHILVSEIMLQQTQVSRVLLFYKKWLKQFPSWQALAQASNVEVVRAWAGLGYNRRALILRDISQHVTKQGVPNSQGAWLALKGIGPYTAAALAVFSLRERVMPIDTNIRRVLDRVLLGVTFPNPKKDGQITTQASNTMQSTTRFYDIPQALFDLANAVCTKIPNCPTCPLRSTCKAAPKFLSGTVRVPKRMIRKGNETIHRDKKFPDRIYRGRILALVRQSVRPVPVKTIGRLIDEQFHRRHDLAWLKRMICRLEKEGFLKSDGLFVSLNRGGVHAPIDRDP